ncbi:hypothetical protein CBR_g16928 [Chara braunii]|uniref:Uncharacterized protein n=1 Tax=Chara braunii TaxID=69332 RepID=A0A388KU60_CHABU|nr:hypothetical protein CBR_g16928 [Chara braunii]|eukprot:GBG73586.1 hypothetical protein CBR_g16928 [Chara braunii]
MDGDIYDKFGEAINRRLGGVRAEAQRRAAAGPPPPAMFRLWQEKEEPPFGVEEVGSDEEVTQGLRGGSETEEAIIIESDDEEEEERTEPPSVLFEKMKDLLDKMGRYQQKLVGLCKEVKGWRSNIPTVFLYDSGPESAPGRPGVNMVGSCPQPGIRGRPLTPQARLAQAARTRNQAKASTSQEPPRGEHEPGRRKEAVEVEDDDEEEEEDERLRREEDQRAEQRARKKGIRGEAELVIQHGPPKKKKYAVRLEEGFDVEKVIDRLLEGHNDLMTLKEILASAPRLRDELKGRLSRRLVSNVHLGTILLKEAEWAESDLYSGYDQFSVYPPDRPVTAMHTPRGLVHMNVAPQGWTNAVAIVQRAMIRAMQSVSPHITQPYINDLAVKGSATKQSDEVSPGVRRFVWKYIQDLEKVLSLLEVLEEHNLTASGAKSRHCMREATILGIVCNEKGRRPDVKKTDKITEWPVPFHSVTDVRSFLGTCGFWRAFVKNFAAKTEHLRKFVRQDQEWVWGEEQEEVVATLKEEFREGGLVSGAPDYDATETRPFIVEMDAGPTALGGVLIQADMEGKERPLRFESRTLCTTERNYSQFKRETLAVLHCLRIFWNYIFGRRSDFTKTAMPRGGKGTRPPQRPLGASGGYERHGPRQRESTPVYNDGDIELFLDSFWEHARRMGWTVTQAIERLRGAEVAGELPEQQQERQRSEAAGALPGQPPSASAKAPEIPEMWRDFWEQRGEELPSPVRAGFGVARKAEERLDRKIKFLAKTTFDRHLLLKGDLAGKKMKEASHGVRLEAMEVEIQELRALVASQAAIIESLRQQTQGKVDRPESSRQGEQRQPGQPSATEPRQEPPMGRVILEPEEARAQRQAEREAFEFRAPTELAMLPVAAAGPVVPLAVKEGLPPSSSEPAQGSAEGSMSVLLEAVHTMQEEVSLFSPE